MRNTGLNELKEMLIERYEYVADLYMITMNENSKFYFMQQLKEIENRIRKIDNELVNL